MSNLLIGLLIMGSFTSFGASVDTLPVATIANAPWTTLEDLLINGMGDCRLEKRGGLPLFYSSRDNGFPVNAARQSYVRTAIRIGDCGVFSVENILANAQWDLLVVLLQNGIGTCRLEKQGGLLMFYSSLDNGVPITASRQSYVRASIKIGDCEE